MNIIYSLQLSSIDIVLLLVLNVMSSRFNEDSKFAIRARRGSGLHECAAWAVFRIWVYCLVCIVVGALLPLRCSTKLAIV